MAFVSLSLLAIVVNSVRRPKSATPDAVGGGPGAPHHYRGDAPARRRPWYLTASGVALALMASILTPGRTWQPWTADAIGTHPSDREDDRPRDASRRRERLIYAAAFAWAIACAVAFWVMVPPGLFIFHAPWLLHPFEQEHLTIARNLAQHGSLVIRDAWLAQPGHGSEDAAFVNGALVPRTGLLVYLIYAVPFLISDTAWVWVTPFFGLLAASAVAAFVRRRTGSVAVSALATLTFITTAPVLLAASGLAFENIIALAFLLWGIYALDRLATGPTVRWSIVAGTALAAAAMVRDDYAPAVALAGFFVLASWAARTWRDRDRRWTREIAPAAAVAAASLVTVMMILSLNAAFYGSPLHTGYGASNRPAASPVWTNSAGGILRYLGGFSPSAFWPMARAFLYHIGGFETGLLVAGIVILALSRRLRISDLTLVAFSAFLIVFNLGHVGTYGGAIPYLVFSPPRYLLAVYSAGVILGFVALHDVAGFLAGGRRIPIILLLSGMTFLAVGTNLRQAYGGPYSIPAADRAVERNRRVHDFAARHEDGVFVGDVYTKAIISQRTIIPRLLPDLAQLAEYVRADLAEHRRVFVVETADDVPAPTGDRSYFDVLQQPGFLLVAVQPTPPILEVVPVAPGDVTPRVRIMSPDPDTTLRGWASLAIDATAQGGVSDVVVTVDQRRVNARRARNFTWTWDTRDVRDGDHVLSVIAVGTSGAVGGMSVPIRVENDPPNAPTVRITSPRPWELVSGSTPVTVDAEGLSGIDRVMYYVDGTYIASSTSAPHGWVFDSGNVRDGIHTIWAKAVDRAGVRSTTYITLDVRNR